MATETGALPGPQDLVELAKQHGFTLYEGLSSAEAVPDDFSALVVDDCMVWTFIAMQLDDPKKLAVALTQRAKFLKLAMLDADRVIGPNVEIFENHLAPELIWVGSYTRRSAALDETIERGAVRGEIRQQQLRQHVEHLMANRVQEPRGGIVTASPYFGPGAKRRQ